MADVIGAAGIVLLDAVEDSVVKADVLKDPDAVLLLLPEDKTV